MNPVYNFAVQSPQNLLQFIVDTQYNAVLERAIGAKVVNTDVGEKNLYQVLLEIAAANDYATFSYILDFPLAQGDNLTRETNDAVAQLQFVMQNKKFQKSDTETSGWSSENTNAAINAFGSIFSSLMSFFSPSNGSGDGGGDGGDGGNEPNPDDTPKTDYMPYIFGGAALLIIVVVVVALLARAKK